MEYQKIIIDTYMVALPIFLSYIVWLLKQSNKKRDANSEGTMLLIRIQIIDYHDKYCKLNFIPSYVLENILKLYQAYKVLSNENDGMIEQMIEEVKNLEIRKGKFDNV